ncbi:hypothetical protein HBI07_252410, partial [Parastagonospora nodorum]
MSAPHELLHQWPSRALQTGSMQASVFAVGISFAVITVVMMGLRMFVELCLRKKTQWKCVEEGKIHAYRLLTYDWILHREHD